MDDISAWTASGHLYSILRTKMGCKKDTFYSNNHDDEGPCILIQFIYLCIKHRDLEADIVQRVKSSMSQRVQHSSIGENYRKVCAPFLFVFWSKTFYSFDSKQEFRKLLTKTENFLLDYSPSEVSLKTLVEHMINSVKWTELLYW